MVFVKKEDKPKTSDLTVAGFRGTSTKKGQVGIEIEIEGARLPKGAAGTHYLDKKWMYVRDGSLRGEDSGEYIFQKPLNFEEVDAALNELWEHFKVANTRIDVSKRTSVHVHLNVLPFYQNRLVSLMALWFIFEEILTHWCGDERVGNLFCIRAKDGPAIITQLKRFIEMRGQYTLNSEALHYSAFNAAAMFTLGSVEIRTLRGVQTPDPVKAWVKILRKLYDASDNYTDPRVVVESFSLDGPMDFFRNIFREEAETIQRGIDLTEDQFRSSLFEGMRFAQDLVYARDWSNFNPTKVTVDPFGRKAKKSPLEQAHEFLAGQQHVFEEMPDAAFQQQAQLVAGTRRPARPRTINTIPNWATAPFGNPPGGNA